jgi:hypothetical protein
MPTGAPDLSSRAGLEREIAALRAEEMSIRDASAFDLPARIGPFLVDQLRPREALLLYAICSPIFLGAGDPTSFASVFMFLRIAGRRPRWCPGTIWPGWLALRLGMVRLSRRRYVALAAALGRFRRETLLDWPAPSGNAASGDPSGPRGSFLSHTVHLIATTYHWPESEILRTPLRRLLIYRKHILADRDLATGRRPTTDMSPLERRLLQSWSTAPN